MPGGCWDAREEGVAAKRGVSECAGKVVTPQRTPSYPLSTSCRCLEPQWSDTKQWCRCRRCFDGGSRARDADAAAACCWAFGCNEPGRPSPAPSSVALSFIHLFIVSNLTLLSATPDRLQLLLHSTPPAALTHQARRRSATTLGRKRRQKRHRRRFAPPAAACAAAPGPNPERSAVGRRAAGWRRDAVARVRRGGRRVCHRRRSGRHCERVGGMLVRDGCTACADGPL